jgi:UDPglucose--hexose-1-phosphate uridylyltransferase
VGLPGTSHIDNALVADDRGRQIVDNASFSVAVPFAARWPFEIHVRARRHGTARLTDLADPSYEVVARYDRLYGIELAYMMCLQEAPAGDTGQPDPDWHLRVEFLLPHRSADRLKMRASVETALGVFIDDTVPEHSAARLAAVDVPTRNWAATSAPSIVDVR